MRYKLIHIAAAIISEIGSYLMANVASHYPPFSVNNFYAFMAAMMLGLPIPFLIGVHYIETCDKVQP